MKKLFRYSAVASIFLLTAGPAAFAQNYNPNYGQGGNPNYGQGGFSGGNQGWNQGGFSRGSQGGTQGWNQGGMGGQGWRQGGWGQGSGSSQQGSSQQSGIQGQDMNGPTAKDAWQELSKFGYRNIGGMERADGWQARATRNGERVFVFIDDEGRVATYRGAGQ